jgi:hypothetical protein
MSSEGGGQEDNGGTAVVAGASAEQRLPPQDSPLKEPALPAAQPITSEAAPAPGSGPADMPRLQDSGCAPEAALASDVHAGAVPARLSGMILEWCTEAHLWLLQFLFSGQHG